MGTVSWWVLFLIPAELSKWGAELEPYQMLSASSITMPIPITSTASAIESRSSQCLPCTRISPHESRNSRGHHAVAPWAA